MGWLDLPTIFIYNRSEHYSTNGVFLVQFVFVCNKGLAQSVASTKIPSKLVFVSSSFVVFAFKSFFIFIRLVFVFGFCNKEASSNFFVLFLFLFVVDFSEVVAFIKVVIFRTTQHKRGEQRWRFFLLVSERRNSVAR